MTNVGMKPEMAEALAVYFHALPQDLVTKQYLDVRLAELKADLINRMNIISLALAALILTGNGIMIGVLLNMST